MQAKATPEESETDSLEGPAKPKKGRGGKKVKGKDKRKTGTKADEEDSKESVMDPIWMRSNFVSLLNLVEMLLLFGPLINYWDGGGKGEKFIQVRGSVWSLSWGRL